MKNRLSVALCLAIFLSVDASAACVNKFTRRSEGPRNVVTILTGELTFQSAQTLANAIRDGKADPVAWVNDSGKVIAQQFGELKVVRPMPVGCNGNPSGVILIVVFPSAQSPSRKMLVKFDRKTTVALEEQSN